MVAHNNSSEWRSNPNNGFLLDYFNNDSIHSSYTIPSGGGTWSEAGGQIIQSDGVPTATYLHIPLTQISSETYLYNWSMKIDGTIGGAGSSGRRGGMHIMSDGYSSYMIYFSADLDKGYIYEYNGGTLVGGTYQTSVVKTVPSNTFFDVKTIYSPASGNIKVYMNDELWLDWTDVTPITTGNKVTLRTGESKIWFDDVRVYKSRGIFSTVTVGTGSNKDCQYQSMDANTNACRVYSVVVDATERWSAIDSKNYKIDPSTKFQPFIETKHYLYIQKMSIKKRSNRPFL